MAALAFSVDEAAFSQASRHGHASYWRGSWPISQHTSLLLGNMPEAADTAFKGKCITARHDISRCFADIAAMPARRGAHRTPQQASA